MFNKKESMPFKPSNASPTINLINSGTIITGEINSNGDVRIDGQLKGTINTKGKVVIGKKGKVEGEINCSNADISGEVNAKTNVSQLSATLLLFVVFFLVFDACQSTCLGVLRGYKDTRTPLFIALLCFWLIGLPIGCILGFGLVSDPMEVFGFWVGLACGVISAAIGLSYRVWSTSTNADRIRLLSQK